VTAAAVTDAAVTSRSMPARSATVAPRSRRRLQLELFGELDDVFYADVWKRENIFF
jgi:hypothetical protein